MVPVPVRILQNIRVQYLFLYLCIYPPPTWQFAAAHYTDMFFIKQKIKMK